MRGCVPLNEFERGPLKSILRLNAPLDATRIMFQAVTSAVNKLTDQEGIARRASARIAYQHTIDTRPWNGKCSIVVRCIGSTYKMNNNLWTQTSGMDNSGVQWPVPRPDLMTVQHLDEVRERLSGLPLPIQEVEQEEALPTLIERLNIDPDELSSIRHDFIPFDVLNKMLKNEELISFWVRQHKEN